MAVEQEWTLIKVQTLAHAAQSLVIRRLVEEVQQTDGIVSFFVAVRELRRRLHPADCPLAPPPEALPATFHAAWEDAAHIKAYQYWRMDFPPRRISI